ncbi:ion channel DMI1 [Marinobacter salinisoli]|uniref:Ion channel DMI1 n=1 Tax=Marinobacter salinisoli TaxID=2769486 RepID=A0ABX7MS29_9GAMM|nr:ion channel DMI1 [Marinobacter salinisoli]QSP95185.1 ion channel DMI1 [Marinobacter salinisoli]
MQPLRLLDRIKFVLERQLVKGAGFQLLVVALFIALISLVGGLLVLPVGETFEHAGAAIWWAFLRLTDPGYLGDDVGSWQRVVSTLLTISGYVVFMGTLVAILTRWLIAKMADLERGLTPVTLKNHLVVLGLSRQSQPLVSELLASSGRMKRFLEKHDTQRLNLVVLSEEASADQLIELRSQPGIGRRARRVILRSGTAIQPEALHRVACLDASVVILPSAPNDSVHSLVSSDVETVKALLSIASLAKQSRSDLPFVVAEIQDIRKRAVIERAYPGAAEVVAGDASISRLVAQNLLHPGLSEVYNEILTAGSGNEVYVRGGESMAGSTLAEIAAARPDAIVLGVLKHRDHEWDVRLVAPSDTRVEAEDRLILLARDYADTEASPVGQHLKTVHLPEPRMRTLAANTESRRILILGWNRRVPSLVAELASYQHASFHVTFVSVVPQEERELTIRRYTGTTPVICRHIEADYMLEGELRQLDPSAYDSIILLSSDRLPSGEEADARAMVGYLQLEDLLSEASSRPQVIMELSDPGNRHLLDGYPAEMLVSPVILSHVLAQVALRRELRVVLDELFTAGGAEIQFRSPSDYPLPDSADFHLLEKTLAEAGEIALGVFRAEPDERGRHLMLNPPRKQFLDIQAGDRLVVLCLTE